MLDYEYVYCVSCDAGSESMLRDDLLRQLPDTVVLYPVFDREELKGGVWTVKTRPLIAGYVFVYSETPIEPFEFYRCERVNRVLGYLEKGHNEYALTGQDLEFARWIFSHEGHIGVSKAMLVGDQTKIIDGPLKRYEGEILKIDRRRRSALVAVSVGESIKNIWLSFHWMTLKNGVLEDWDRQSP